MRGCLQTVVWVMTALWIPAAVFSQDQTKGGSTRSELPPEVICYKCVYMLVEGRVSGDNNCQERLWKTTSVGVGTETCRGSCYKTFHRHGPQTFSYFRGCVTGCQEHQSSSTYTKCCTQRLCNGGTAGFAMRLPGVTTCLTAAFLVMCIIHCICHVGIS